MFESGCPSQDGNKGFENPGRRGRRRPVESRTWWHQPIFMRVNTEVIKVISQIIKYSFCYIIFVIKSWWFLWEKHHWFDLFLRVTLCAFVGKFMTRRFTVVTHLSRQAFRGPIRNFFTYPDINFNQNTGLVTPDGWRRMQFDKWTKYLLIRTMKKTTNPHP